MSEETNDLPYRAEYSKSGRASCRGCKTPIAKDVLRLAAMVPSPMFDGRVPNWYHFPCFFGKQRPKTVADIGHFESLRWEDQEKIKNKVENSGAPLPDAGGKGKGKKRAGAGASSHSAPNLVDFTVEYAKSKRATCRGCEQKILKDEVRIAKKDYQSEVGMRYGGQQLWHHVDCFAKIRATLEFWEAGTALPGIKTLSKEDQKIVADSLPKIEPIKSESTDTTDGPTEAKKAKVDPEAKEMKKQNDLQFKFRDTLKGELSKRERADLLEFNKQQVPPGEDEVLLRLSDIMTFGALQPCTKCSGGQLVFQSGAGYRCQGDLTKWTKCQALYDEPQRKPFKVPPELAEKYDFLAKYKYKARGKKLFKKVTPSASAVKKEEGDSAGPILTRALPPLLEMEFVVAGRTLDKKKMKTDIAKLGGKLVGTIHDKVAAVIATEEDVKKMGAVVTAAKNMDIQVVDESFLELVKTKPAREVIAENSICSWGSDVNARVPEVKLPTKSKSGSMFKKSMPSKQLLKVKGGSAVDPDSRLDDVAHVYKHGKDVYNAVLSRTDIQGGKNSYYKLQLLAADHGSNFWVFRAWGRIGTTQGNTKVESGTLHEMKDLFEDLYEQKTGNCWSNRHNFVKVPGRMYPVDVDYNQEEEDSLKLSSTSTVPSKLPLPVQELVKMLFDIDTMKKVMREFELDMEKMPLGKLSKRQLQKALSVLTDLQELVGSEAEPVLFIDASNRFYTLIPHDFGMDTPPVINSQDMIKKKLEMVESLMEMEVAYSLLKAGKAESAASTGAEINPVDAHYAQLNTDTEVLDRDSEEFKHLEEYVQNTHGATHTGYSLEILEVFKVRRHGEEKRYKPFRKLHNRKLLWHGSRLTNFAGILSQGLRIAPPEAPVTGYMFGKGIYFADMVSKSANYCCTSAQSPVGLMLLCEVALGNMYERDQADYIEKLPKGMHSTKGVGRIQPDPASALVRPDGVELPLGKGLSTQKSSASLIYNEYIVYDVAQVNIQYLLKMNFKYKY